MKVKLNSFVKKLRRNPEKYGYSAAETLLFCLDYWKKMLEETEDKEEREKIMWEIRKISHELTIAERERRYQEREQREDKEIEDDADFEL